MEFLLFFIVSSSSSEPLRVDISCFFVFVKWPRSLLLLLSHNCVANLFTSLLIVMAPVSCRKEVEEDAFLASPIRYSAV